MDDRERGQDKSQQGGQPGQNSQQSPEQRQGTLGQQSGQQRQPEPGKQSGQQDQQKQQGQQDTQRKPGSGQQDQGGKREDVA